MAIKKLNEKSEEKIADIKLGEEVEETLEGKELEKAAEKESVDEKAGSDLEKKRKILLEKAAKLKEKLTEEIPTSEELKEKVKIKKRTDMLIPLDEYVKAGIYLGTKVVTPEMRPFVYRRRADGLAIFNTDLIKLNISIENAEDIFKKAIEVLEKEMPEASKECEFCEWVKDCE